MQIGADIYCDTRCILREIDRRYPKSPLYGPGGGDLIAAWADSTLFVNAVGVVFGTFADQFPREIKDDRRKFTNGLFDADRMKAHQPAIRAQFRAHAQWIERALADGRAHLMGSAPGIADFALYHPLWFVRGNMKDVDLLAGCDATKAWFERMTAFGHGKRTPLDAKEALAIAKDARPEPVERRRSRRSERAPAGRARDRRRQRLWPRARRRRAAGDRRARDRHPPRRPASGRSQPAFPARRLRGRCSAIKPAFYGLLTQPLASSDLFRSLKDGHGSQPHSALRSDHQAHGLARRAPGRAGAERRQCRYPRLRRARIVAAPDFAKLIGGAVAPRIALATTQPGHIVPVSAHRRRSEQVTVPVSERSPNGNAVSLEEQMMKVSDTTNDYALTTSLYKKQISMLKMVLGRGSSS